MRAKRFISALACACLASNLFAFQVKETWQTDPEGGKVEALILNAEPHRFTFQAPYQHSLKSDAVRRELQFTSTNRTAIVITLSPDYPRGLPDEATLKREMLQRYEGAAILRSSACPSGLGAGWAIDVKRHFTREISLITRHVFVPWMEGMIHFSFSADSEEFELHRHLFAGVLNSFRLLDTPLNPASDVPSQSSVALSENFAVQ